MRHPRLTGASPSLVLAAHGSSDARFADVVDAIARQVRGLRPGLDVVIGYLEHGPPHLTDVVTSDAVVVPLLLSAGYHVRVDLPRQAPTADVTAAVGPDPRLASALAERLAEAGYAGNEAVVLAAAGSADQRALADVHVAAAQLAQVLGVPVTAAFVSAGEPRLANLRPSVVASYLLAPGAFHDAVRATGASVVAGPIGAHPAVAGIVLDRYDAQVPGRTAPA